MNTDKQALKSVIEELKTMADKPSIYFADATECRGFLRGVVFSIALSNIVELERYQQTYETVARKHGWTWVANSFFAELKGQNLEEQTIMKKLIQVEVVVLSALIDE